VDLDTFKIQFIHSNHSLLLNMYILYIPNDLAVIGNLIKKAEMKSRNLRAKTSEHLSINNYHILNYNIKRIY
jgi:hypothetical protein